METMARRPMTAVMNHDAWADGWMDWRCYPVHDVRCYLRRSDLQHDPEAQESETERSSEGDGRMKKEMSDKTAMRLWGLFAFLVIVVLLVGVSMAVDAQWLDEAPVLELPSYDTVWFGDGYMNVHLSPGQLPPYIINISDLEFIEAVYVDGAKVSLERIDPLASFIGGMFIGMAILLLLVGM